MPESQDDNQVLPDASPVPPTAQQVSSSDYPAVQRQPSRQPRLVALKVVTIEAHWHQRQAVWEFYSDLLGLGTPNILVEPAGTFLLIFPNDGPDLLVRFTTHPEIWPNRPRAVLELPDLPAVRQRLADAMIEHQILTGWTWPEQRIGLWDPSGNRLEIKQLWRVL